jgi:hypothetical protein
VVPFEQAMDISTRAGKLKSKGMDSILNFLMIYLFLNCYKNKISGQVPFTLAKTQAKVTMPLLA